MNRNALSSELHRNKVRPLLAPGESQGFFGGIS